MLLKEALLTLAGVVETWLFLGTILLVFVVTHMQNFWYMIHFRRSRNIDYAGGEEIKDLHTVVMISLTFD